MNKLFLTFILSVALSGLLPIHAQDGFVIWGKIEEGGTGCDRTLHYNKITNGTEVGEAKLVVEKGPGADIWPVISPDGEWIAWARGNMEKNWNHKYGKCDYHDFDKWDVYIARIDFGNTIPVKKIIKIADGYFPSWAEDAKTPNQPKTLYFTRETDQTIQKTTINPDGTFSDPVEHGKCAKRMTGTNAHTQGSPDGKYIAYRPGGIKVQVVATGEHVSGAGGKGCHPCWGPRSKYLVWSQDNVCRLSDDGASAKGLGKAGVGAYFQGISNDAYFDEGKLWVIGKLGKYVPKTQNGAGSIEFKEVDISNNGWKVGPGIKVGSGCSPDIHFFPPGGPPKPVRIGTKDQINGLAFSAEVFAGANGLQLIINSRELAGHNVRLYNIQGRRTVFINLPGSSSDIMPLNGQIGILVPE